MKFVHNTYTHIHIHNFLQLTVLAAVHGRRYVTYTGQILVTTLVMLIVYTSDL